MPTPIPVFQQFIDNAIQALQHDPNVIGLAVGGSWVSDEMDAFSDLDLILVTTYSVAPDLESMRMYASQLGRTLSSFRGDHVGEKRLLVALYDAPLLHVDIKFLTLAEFYERVEEPVIVWERDHLLTDVIHASTAQYPPFEFQTTEDRFWIWMHYALLKTGRGEYFEALDFLSFVRNRVVGPMLQVRNNGLPKGVRRIEMKIAPDDITCLQSTVAIPEFSPLMRSIAAMMKLYEDLLESLAPATLNRHDEAQQAVWAYYDQILRINPS